MYCLICGMELKKESLILNSSAFLKKNEEARINNCPFCGASRIYFGDILDNKANEDLDEKTKVIFDHAMKLEVFNGEFYKEASKLATDKKISEMFKALSNIELMHAMVHKSLGGFKELPKLTKIDYSKYNNDRMLLELAMKREEHAVKYYEKYISYIDDEKTIRVFKALTEVEKEHIILIG